MRCLQPPRCPILCLEQIMSEHLFSRTPLSGCFCICHNDVMNCQMQYDTTLFQFFESCQKVEVKLPKLVVAVL